MPNFAVHDGVVIQNVVIAQSKQEAEEVTGLSALETNGIPWIGWTMEAEGWRRPSPHPSWSWSGTNWEPPTPAPTDGHDYAWDEESGDWIEVFPPEYAQDEQPEP